MKKTEENGITLIALVMKFCRNNVKVIIGFIVGVVLAGGIVYAAVTSADEISYMTEKNEEINNVQEALNDLYSKKQDTIANSGGDKVFLLNTIMDDEDSMETNNWTYAENDGIVLNTTARDDSYFSIPFQVSESGKYLCFMKLTQNDQYNNTSNPLYYGISTSKVTSYSSSAYDVSNLSSVKVVELNKDQNYYIGAVNRLTWNYSGYSRAKFSDIVLCKIN